MPAALPPTVVRESVKAEYDPNASVPFDVDDDRVRNPPAATPYQYPDAWRTTSPPVNHVAPPSVELVESSYDASPKTVSALSRAAHLKETALGECDAVAEAETVGACVGEGVGVMSDPVTHVGHG